jgi:hypothetical protein
LSDNVRINLRERPKRIWDMESEKSERFTCLDEAFKDKDQLKTNTALKMESAKIEFKVI